MTIKARLNTLAAAVMLLATPAIADTTEVLPSHDLTVARSNGTPTVQGGLHPKNVSKREKSALDRFIMLRFDSEEFGKGVKAAALILQARDDEKAHEGRHRFRVYGVRDGDKEDELIEEKGYKPSAPGTLFENTSTMVDRKQVSVLGTFTTETGKQVQFLTSSLTSFVRADRNGTITLLIIRETDGGENSVFNDRKTNTPPKLVMKVAKKADPKPEEAPAPEGEPKPE